MVESSAVEMLQSQTSLTIKELQYVYDTLEKLDDGGREAHQSKIYVNHLVNVLRMYQEERIG